MLLILYNSQSGKGKGKRIAQQIKENLTLQGLPFEMYRDSEWPTKLANYELVWLIGGDGSLNYYLNKYPESNLPLGLFPGGTGNDFYTNLQTHFNINQLIDQYLSKQIRKVDLGICNGHRFLNTIGIGFDGEVLKDMTIARWVGGHLGYLLIVIKHLFLFKELSFKYDRDGIPTNEKLLLFFISNAPTTGGGFIISPKAKIDDGHLHIVTAKPTKILKRLFLLPKVEKGTHLSHPNVNHWTTKKIHIVMEKSTFYQIDGELKSASEFEIILLEQAIDFLV
ncbi:MAG: diacylglycerol kinase (ATP) [Saprospiraceae bacterium]|jgi:diacylglycerol kinase (ATP)